MNKPVIVFLHIGYWLIFTLLLFVLFGLSNAATAGDEDRDFKNLFDWLKLMFGTTILPAILCFYGYYGILFTRYLHKRKIAAFFIGALVVAVLSAVIGALVGSLDVFLGKDFFLNKNPETAISIVLFLAFVAMLSGVVGLVMRGFITWYSEIKVKEELGQKNFEMELALVKSQINPHFLFNTINNIDVLINKDPAMASKYLLSLSDIMRFMLYETKPDRILLSKEIEYIEKFIALHKIRSNNADYVQFKVTGASPNLTIAPMLFIPFIENAFKHVYNKKLSPAIEIKMHIERDTIHFNCNNNYNETTTTDILHSGLGDGLIRKRLQLLYPDKHVLTTSAENSIYAVTLTINCSL